MGGFSPSSTYECDDDSSVGSSSPHFEGEIPGANDDPSDSSPTNVDALKSDEASAVRRSKMLVYTALLLTAGIGTLIYFLMSNEEMSTCQQSFHAYAKEVAEISDAKVVSIFSHVNALAIAITSYSLNGNMSYPNVTLPNFDARTNDVVQTSAIPMAIFSPIVRDSDRKGWEAYTAQNDWINQDLKYNKDLPVHPGPISPKIFPFSEAMFPTEDEFEVLPNQVYKHQEGVGNASGDGSLEGMSFPLWQLGPMPWNASIIMMDLGTNPSFRDAIHTAMLWERNILSGVMDLDFLHRSQGWNAGISPRSTAIVPVRDDFYNDSKVVGLVFGKIKWVALFDNILPPGTAGIVAVVSDQCSQDFALLIEGDEVTFLGYGPAENFTELARSHFHESYPLADFVRDNESINKTDHHQHCNITLTLYSTASFEDSCKSNQPAIYTTAVVLVFFVTIVTFALYDFWVTRRQRKLLAQARRTDAIVSSLFPKHVQQRMMEDATSPGEASSSGNWKGRLATRHQPHGSLHDATGSTLLAPVHESRPIADLYAESTILFADIVGFTQWASCRVPCDVFMLLESIFAAFDEIASHRRVYKVETVGDCYVAACGVPEPRKDHALVMARFARDCVVAFNAVVKKLETELGPDTGDLGVRVGINSGPVTAGVLRGKGSRFQLFGDTMNTCSRIESTGEKNKIHMSHETAELLMAHGKSHWCRKREESVNAKGKGVLSTFWLEVKGESTQSTASSTNGTDTTQLDVIEAHLLEEYASVQDASYANRLSEQVLRLVKWDADLLKRKLCAVVAQRTARKVKASPRVVMYKLERDIMEQVETPSEEVKDAIGLSCINAGNLSTSGVQDAAPVELGPVVTEQLHSYLMAVALLYRENAFHCFEHATHVTMSVVKLLTRVNEADETKKGGEHAYEVLSEPLTQFAVVFSALIHDVDHKGVPNRQLTKESDPVASVYSNQSPAEQNSIDVAWSLLMMDEYQDLRAAIYATPDELLRFRQLVVNSVMATDIMDRDLNLARKERWNQAFNESSTSVETANRRATIVLEHLIQASDVAHTMQHWNIYRNWNSRFFEESYDAYAQGRADSNPGDSWYEGELGFFDHYIIPLARKLKDCGAFGVSSDEYLGYAQQNRREWENQGRELVAEMVKAAKAKLNKE